MNFTGPSLIFPMFVSFSREMIGDLKPKLFSPQDLKRFVLPWYRKYAELVHENGKLYFLHSCGNVEKIMKELIDFVKMDAKHPFEDSIVPVTELYRKYSSRIGVLGGVDIHLLSTLEEESLRKYVRNILSFCMGKGRYALGSGNSIANYIPLKNYLLMVEEGLNWKG